MASRARFYNNDMLSDVTLKIGYEDEYQEIKAHKIVCVMESGWFARYFLERDSPNEPADICDLRGVGPTSTQVPAIKHMYGLPYHDFDQDKEVDRDSSHSSAADDTELTTWHADNNPSFLSDAATSTNIIHQPEVTHAYVETESKFDEAMYHGGGNDLHRALLSDRFFNRTPELPYDEDNLDQKFSKLHHHGNMYQCAENLEIPSLAATITANASKIFFESAGTVGFASDLIDLFKVHWNDNSFPDAIASLCLEHLDLTFKDRDFSEKLLQYSPFTGYLLLKVLTRNS